MGANITKSVLFWRADHWHAGWVQEQRADGTFRVGWIEANRLLSKVVDKVTFLEGIPWGLLATPPTT